MSESLHPKYLLEFTEDIGSFYCNQQSSTDHFYIVFYPSGLILDIYMSSAHYYTPRYIPETNSIHGPIQNISTLTMTGLSPTPKTYEFFSSEDNLSFMIKKSDGVETSSSDELYPFYTCNCTHAFYEPTGDGKIGGPSGIGSYGCAKLLFIDPQLGEYRDNTTIDGVQTEEQVQLYPIYKDPSNPSTIYFLNKTDLLAGTYNFLTSYSALLQFSNLDESHTVYNLFKNRYATSNSAVTNGNTAPTTNIDRTDLPKNILDNTILQIEQHPRYGVIKNKGIIYDKLYEENTGYRDKNSAQEEIFLLTTQNGVKYTRKKPYVLFDNKTSTNNIRDIHKDGPEVPCIQKIDEYFLGIVTDSMHLLYRIPPKGAVNIFKREPYGFNSFSSYLVSRNLPDDAYPNEKRKIETTSFKGEEGRTGSGYNVRLAASTTATEPIYNYCSAIYNGPCSAMDDPLNLDPSTASLCQYVYGNFITILDDIADITPLQGELVNFDTLVYDTIRDCDFSNVPHQNYGIQNGSISSITGIAVTDSSLNNIGEGRKQVVDDHIFKDYSDNHRDAGFRYRINEGGIYKADNITQLYVPHHYIMLYYPAPSGDINTNEDFFRVTKNALGYTHNEDTAPINGDGRYLGVQNRTTGTLQFSIYNFIQGKPGYGQHNSFIDINLHLKTAQSGIAKRRNRTTFISDANFESQDYEGNVGYKTLDYSDHRNGSYAGSIIHGKGGISLANQITNNFSDYRGIVVMFDPTLNE